MTQQDDITQRVLTAEHHLNELMRLTQPWPNATIPCATVRSHVEQALSKLRAPVADERDRNATISQIVGLCNRIPGATTWNAAQFMYDEMHRRAALASAPVVEQAALFAQSTTKDDKAALGMLECGKPLCAPGEHHPLCRHGWAEKKGASAPTPKPWPVEEQPDGTVIPVDPVDMASAPVAGEAPTDADLDKLYRETVTEGPDNDTRCWENPHLLYARAVLSLYAAPQASECECSRKSKAVSDSEAQL